MTDIVVEKSPSSLIDEVRINQGTASTKAFSNGNTLPLVGMPFGMTHWSLETAGGAWFYHPADRKLRGIRVTRQPSPWIKDYGDFTFLPQTGPVACQVDARATAFRPEEARLSPDQMSLSLIRDGIEVDLCAHERCAIAEIQFPEATAKRILFETGNAEHDGDGAEWYVDKHTNTLSGIIRSNHGGVPENFASYVVIQFNCAVDLEHSVGFHYDGSLAGAGSTEYQTGGMLIAFDASNDLIEMRIATSFISFDQAQLNAQQELTDQSLASLRSLVRETWNQQLSIIEIDGASEEQRLCFYSAMYRSLLFPRMIHEIDAAGQTIHYSPYDGEVHTGPLYTDNGFWDTHRTVYPLLSIICPERLSDILEGWINAYREGGWMPKWASPGYKACMIGTHIDAVFADAYAKGVPFNAEAAYEGLKKHAFTESDGSNNHGRIGLSQYIKLGYVPCDEVHEATSRTMDFAYNDWCIAQIADGLGDTETRDQLLERSTYYKNVFDPDVGFMRGRNADGSWRFNDDYATGFSATEWGGVFVEGSAWQCGWAVQHDSDGFIALHGGAKQIEEKLDQLLATPPRFEVGYYGQEIHEMSEMAAVDFGQYAQSNQPSHHILYYYSLVGRLDKCGYWTQKTCKELYDSSPQGLPGDEDNGEMSAWYIFSALGFYPFCPGSDAYVLGCPLFNEARIHLSNGNTCTIKRSTAIAEDCSNIQWQLNEQPIKGVQIKHNAIIEGHTLEAATSSESA